MGKSDAPATPDYKGQAIATGNSGKYSEISPYGAVNWSVRPGADLNNPQPGDYIRTTTLNPEQKQLYDQTIGNQLALGSFGAKQLGELNSEGSGKQALQDSLYRRATQYYDQNFGDQEASLRSQLLNSGLAEGSEAYDRAMRTFGQTRSTAYADAADRAVVNSEQQYQANRNNAISRLASIMTLARGQTPQSANASGGQAVDLSGAAQNTYNANLGAVNASNAQAAQTNSALGTAAVMALMYY